MTVVEQLAARDHAAYQAYVDAHPKSGCYHHLAWGLAASRAYGMKTPFLVTRNERGGPITGALPLFVVENPAGSYVTSALFGGYAAPLGDSDEERAALFEESKRVTREAGAKHVNLKVVDEEGCPPGFVRREMGVVATLAIDPDPAKLERGLGKTLRYEIRAARRSGFELRAGFDELPGFYDVLAENYHRKGTPIYGYRLLRDVVSGFGERAEVVTLRRGAQTIAGGLVLHHHGTTTVPFFSAHPDHRDDHPSALAYWHILDRARARGHHTLDFGRSPVGSGSLTWKLRFHATTRPQPYLLHATRGEVPALNKEDPNVQRLIELWKRLPRSVADALGPSVHRRFLV